MLLEEFMAIAACAPDGVKPFALKVADILQKYAIANIDFNKNELPANHYAKIYESRLNFPSWVDGSYLGVEESVRQLYINGNNTVLMGAINVPESVALVFISTQYPSIVGAMLFKK